MVRLGELCAIVETLPSRLLHHGYHLVRGYLLLINSKSVVLRTSHVLVVGLDIKDWLLDVLRLNVVEETQVVLSDTHVGALHGAMSVEILHEVASA